MGRSHERQDNYSSISHIVIGTGGDVALSDSDIVFPVNALPPRGFMIAVEGDVKIRTVDGKDDTYLSGELLVGVLYPFGVIRVYETGSNAAMKARVYW